MKFALSEKQFKTEATTKCESINVAENEEYNKVYVCLACCPNAYELNLSKVDAECGVRDGRICNKNPSIRLVASVAQRLPNANLK